MNAYIQISLGLILTLILLTIIIIRRKAYKLVPVLLITMMFSTSIWASYKGISIVREGLIPQDVEVGKYIIRELIREGQHDVALSSINKLQVLDKTSDELTLNTARIKALEGSIDSALLLYEKANELYKNNKTSGFPEEEYEILQNLANSNTDDQLIVQYLNEENLSLNDYEYSNLDSGTEKVNNEAYKDAVLKNLRQVQSNLKETDSKYETIDAIANITTRTEVIYNDYLEKDNIDIDELNRVIKKYKTIEEENPSITKNETYRTSKLKALTLKGNYKELSNSANEDVTNNELMILSELYMNGLVKESNFSEDFVHIEDEVYEKVIAQCESIYNNKIEDESKQIQKETKEKINSLKKEKKHKVLSEIKHRIESDLDSTPLEDTSKLNLQLSKIENYLDNQTQADYYMNKAMDTVGASDDDNYAIPMHEIKGIISGGTETETIKNVAGYVNQVVDNSLPVKIVTIDEYNEQISSDNDENNDKSNFNQYFTNYVSKKKAIINIGAIDIEEFPIVRARLQVDSDIPNEFKKLKDLLTITDCGIKIDDFTLDKLQFKSSKVLLLCDVSGSMNGNVEDLKSAVSQFSENMDRNEQLSIVGFDSNIVFNYDFTTDTQIINEAINRLGAYGGTDIYNALKQVLSSFPQENGTNNVVILMTDGQDNNKASSLVINEDIGRLANDYGITIYTVGLGNDVDTEYLTNIANSGNGKFLYVQDASSLREFYNFIHNQLSNQYVLTYTAPNTSDNTRELVVTMDKEGVSDRKTYYLVEPESPTNSTDGSNYKDIVKDAGDIQIYGLDKKFIYRGSKETHVNLKGKGFNKDERVTISLINGFDYIISSKYIDEETIELTIPPVLLVGEYDLQVSTKGQVFDFKKEFTIAKPGKEATFEFGPYKFTSLQKFEEGPDKLTLRGNVTMNGWLRFKGDVVIQGDYKNGTTISVTDRSGSYISYNVSKSKGLAKVCAEKGITIPIPALGNFSLYNDQANLYDAAKYRVDEIFAPRIPLVNLAVENLTLRLYQDKIDFTAADINLFLPFQDAVIRAFGYNPFNFSSMLHGVITENNIGLVGEVNYLKSREKTELKTFNLVGKLPLSLKSGKVTIDTLNNDYYIKMQVFLSQLQAIDSIGFEFGIKNMQLDTIMLLADYKWHIVRAPIPITLDSFGVGLSDIKLKADNKNTNILLDSFITGNFRLSVAKLSAYISKLADFLGDPAVLTVRNASLKLRLREFALNFTAEVRLFDELVIGNTEVSIGNFEYANALLGLDKTNVAGLKIKPTSGLFWDGANLDLNISGTNEITFTNKYAGIWSSGVCDVDINWFFIDNSYNVRGDMLLGFFMNSKNNLQFTILLKGISNDGIQKGFRLDMTKESILPMVNLY